MGNVPWCYYPSNYLGYTVRSSNQTATGMTYTMQRMTSSGWPADVNILALDVIYETQQRLHFKVCSVSFIMCMIKVNGFTFRGSNCHFNFCFPSQWRSGPGCSKLTILLVNNSLNFQKLISQICQYFMLKKCEKLLQYNSFSHFFNKKFQCICYKVVKHLTS